MSVTVNAPKTPVTKGSNGIAAATVPNICKMPGPPAPFVPAPLPNIGKSGSSPKGYSKKVKVKSKNVAIKGATFKSIGDVASKGTGGGLVSANTHGITKFVGPGSLDVKFEGKNVHLLSDPMLNNCGGSGSPPNAATLQGVIQVGGLSSTGDIAKCSLCGEQHDGLKETDEEGGTRADAGALASALQARVAGSTDDVRTMLGVVHGKCNTKYADQSGPTTPEFSGAADAAGMRHHPSADFSVKKPGKAPRRKTVAKMKKHVVESAGGSASLFEKKLEDAWTKHEEARKDSTLPQANPPGTCAAQGAMVLLLERGCLPAAMTEQWFSSKGTAMKGTIDFIDQRPIPKQTFDNGESVPPCGVCVIMLPMLLCDKDKDECSH